VLVRRVVAAADVPAVGAPAQVHPDATGQQAFDAAVPAGRDGSDLVEMRAGVSHGCILAEVSSRAPGATAPYDREERDQHELTDRRVEMSSPTDRACE